MNWLERRAHGFLTISSKINRPVDLMRMWEYIDTKEKPVIDTGEEQGMQVKKVAWTDPHTDAAEVRWSGPPPAIRIIFQEPAGGTPEYEKGEGLLLELTFTYDKKTGKISEKEMARTLLQVITPARHAGGAGCHSLASRVCRSRQLSTAALPQEMDGVGILLARESPDAKDMLRLTVRAHPGGYAP
jgi:hypothetical protein